MKWLKRGLWITAWAVWAWLGFGLYRELPRRAGPVVCQIAVPSKGRIVGFDGPSKLVVSDESPGRNPTLIVFDAETGASTAKFAASTPGLAWRIGTIHQGFYLINDRAAGRGPDGFQALDLKDGTRHEISAMPVASYSVHPTEPLVAFIGSVVGRSGLCVVVRELKTGKTVFESEIETGGRQIDAPFFAAETDKLVVPGRRRGYQGPDPGTDLLVFSYRQPNDLPKSVTFEVGPTARSSTIVSRNGRAVFGPAKNGSFEVFDFKRCEVVFKTPEAKQKNKTSLKPSNIFRLAISADGSAVLGGQPQMLWDVDHHNPIWKARSFDMAFSTLEPTVDPDGLHFFVAETWDQLWRDWFPGLPFATVAVRDLSSGELLWRMQSHPGQPSRFNENWTLGIAKDGTVYRLPYRVNWPLLALCQTILSLPLIFLWSIVRWRMRRRLRVASVQP